MELETIKSYLVELGIAINKASQSQFFKDLAALESKIEDFAAKTVKGVGKAADAFVNLTKAAVEGGTKAAAAFAVVNVGLTKFLSSMGQAEIGVEKFASQFYISYNNARQLQGVLKALHANIEDLYRSPTLLRQFQELRAESAKMAVPGDYRQQIGLLQVFTFQFTRLRLEVTTSFQWIAYWFAKTFNGPITNITEKFKTLNDRIVQLMPVWTKLVAEWAGMFFRLDATAFKALEYIASAVSKMPPKLKEFGAALLAIGLILKMGPFGIMSTILTGVLLLLDDFFTYMRGGDSLLGPFWKTVMDWFKQLKESGVIDKITAALQDLGDGFTTMLSKIAGSLGEHKGIFDQLLELFINLEPKIKWLLTDGIPNLINKVLDLSEKFLIWLNQGDHLNELITAIKWIAIGMLAAKAATELFIGPLMTVIGLINGLKALKGIFSFGKKGGAAAEGGAAASEGAAAAEGGAVAGEVAGGGFLAGVMGLLTSVIAPIAGLWTANGINEDNKRIMNDFQGSKGSIDFLRRVFAGTDTKQNGPHVPNPDNFGVPEKSGYVYPGAKSPNVMTGSIKNDYGGNVFNTNPTFNIYSNGDPVAISNTVNKNLDDILIYRLHRGVVLA